MHQGYLIFEGIECVYSKIDNSLIVTPKNESQIRELFLHVDKTNFFLEYQHSIYKKSVAYIEKILPRMDHSFSFITSYTLALIGDYEVSGFILTGDDVDIFFSPSRYFFQKKRNNGSINTELLFEKEDVDIFQFTYREQMVKITLYYGEVLKNGIFSDLKIHAQLFVEFNKTRDYSFLHGVYNTLLKFFQLVRYQKYLNLNSVDIIGPTEKHERSILGKMSSNLYISKEFRKTSDSEYIIFKPYISKLFQIISDDKDFSIRHLPLNDQVSYDYDVLRYLSVFASFEYECNKNPEEYLLKSDEPIKEIKKDLLQYIEVMKKQFSKQNELIFLENACNRISQLDTQYGQEKKIINAFDKTKNIISSSIVHLLPTGYTIKKVASEVTKLRAKIAHDNLYRDLSDEEKMTIRFIEVLSYILLLKRTGIDEDTIELIIGAVFHCNFKYIEYNGVNIKGK